MTRKLSLDRYCLYESTRRVLEVAASFEEPFNIGDLSEAVFLAYPTDSRFLLQGRFGTYPDTRRVSNYLYGGGTGLVTYGMLAKASKTHYRVTPLGLQLLRDTNLQVKNKDPVEFLVRTALSTPLYQCWKNKAKFSVADAVDFWRITTEASNLTDFDAVDKWCSTVLHHKPIPGKYYTLKIVEIHEFLAFYEWVKKNHLSAFYLEESP